ncbi:MAG: deoxyribodipyrimidine photo-lyase [Candidatus Azotimanducaceae bacterium]|jgi:deoxyribodipyrimidine photo-lyase
MNLFWFRSDLRAYDNLALSEAIATGNPVTAIYIATPEQWKMHDDAPIKLDFWRRNLLGLEESLKRLGIPLLYFQVASYAEVPHLFKELALSLKFSHLYFNAEYPLNEHRRDGMVETVCLQQGIRINTSHDQVLLQPGSVLNKSVLPFRVFTPFSRKCRTMIRMQDAPKAISVLNAPVSSLPQLKAQCGLEDIDWPEANVDWASRWPAGEAHAQALLQTFCENSIKDYKENRDFPAVDGTSTLAPWMNAGVISIRDCWRKATSCHQGDGAETWKSELLWREFYKHIFFHYPHVSKKLAFKPNVSHVPWRHDKEDFKRWCEGRTGIPIVDAAMRQLSQTGWMHNRLRMVTAMFLTKHLLIDWRWGEKWFMEHLVDGDFSANNGGWQWSASTGTDSVPYFRVFNPVTQSKRFDAEGDFIRKFVPELKNLDRRFIHEPKQHKPPEYPDPLIDLKFGRERALNAFKSE